MSDLSASIKSLYQHISDEEVILAESNLIGFFKTLAAIESRLAHEKSNETEYEYFRSSN